MNDNFKIIFEFIKDCSIETPDVQTLIYVRENISSYQMDIDIKSKALKNKMIEVNTKLLFSDKEKRKKQSIFEIIYATVIKINENVKDKKQLEKIILCDLQLLIYPKIEKIFLRILQEGGFPNIQILKKVDFEKLYKEQTT